MQALAASLRVYFCNEWKRAFPATQQSLSAGSRPIDPVFLLLILTFKFEINVEIDLKLTALIFYDSCCHLP
jgi:hypothetical protein